MLKAHKYKLIPTKAQTVLLNKHIGASRFVYNLALEVKQTAYSGNKVSISCFDLIKQLPDLKNECEWLKEINSQSLQQCIRNLDLAYTRFFKGQGNFPRYKRKRDSGSFNVPQSVSIANNKLIIPKFKNGIKLILHRPIDGKIKQATITKTAIGKYFVSILIDTEQQNKQKVNINKFSTIGIDLGIKSFLTSSDDTCFDNPKYLKNSLDKLKYIQRKYSRKKGKRTKYKLVKLHEKIANQRKDFLHKTSTYLIKSHDSIAIEDLHIKGMLANHKLAQSISDCGWSTFLDMLQYKADWYGKNILKVGRFEPSSKMCHCCGYKLEKLSLAVRNWECPNCNTIHDRDINAAINIREFALNKYLSGEHRLKNQNELPMLVGVMTSEAHSPLGKG